MNEFNDLFTEEELDINCENYKFEDYGKIEEIFPKIINILKNCPKFYLKSESILNKYPNLIEKLSKQEKKELFQLIKNEKDPIKKALMNKIFEEATDNDEIISLIDIFILWEKPDIYDILEKEINKLNFQSMSKECSEKFSKLFKNFGFFRSKGKFDENNYDKNIFFIILSKLQNIHEFPDIFWNLFEPNMLYNFTNDENNLFYSTYQELFQKNSIEDNRNNLFKLTNGILQWLISNKIKLCDFFNDLEQKLKSDKEEENLITQKFITNTYIEFLVNYNKNQLISDYIINYLKTKIEKLNKENLEKILNLENESQKILQFFIPYKLTRQNFFENENENIKLFKLIKSIPQNKYIINSIYYQNSLEIIKNIGLKLQTFTCSYQELLQITKWSDEELKSRIEILELNSELKNFLKTKIKEKINFYGDIIEKLSLSSEYFKKIEATDNEDKKYKQKINYLKSTFADNKNLEDKTLDKVDDYLKKDDFSVHLNKLSKRAKNFQIFQKFECGKMFIKSVNFKLEKEETKYQEISLNINKMKDIFYQDTILQMNDDKIMDFLNLFSSEKSFLEELNSLKNFFQIENEETDEFLRLNFKRELIKKIVLSYIQTIQKLNISPVIFKDIQNIKLRLLELEKSKKTFDEEEMKNNFSILNQIISDFESMGDLIKLKIEPIDKISSILYNLWDNNIFDFLFNITNNDIRDLTNSLTGTLVDSNDIDNYLKVKQLIVFLKKEANYHPKNFEEEIDELINENNTEINYEIKKDIEFFGSLLIEIDSFLNEMKISDINQLIKETSKKKLHVNELLKNRKGYEKNREEINLIMNESKIEIYYIENQDNKSEEEKIGYNCKIIFSNSKIKYLDYIIELQQIASLSQNKNQDNHIFISFIEIVDKIKDLINYCSILTAKGFPDIFKFEIEIKKEVETFIDLTYEKKEKNFENQKNEMKNILKIMDDLQSNAYKNSCYLKFFSGQQLFKINNYIKNKIGNDDEKNSEIKHLLTHLMGDDFSKFNIDYIYRQSIPSSKFENFQTENCPFDIDDNYNEKDENEENIINTDRLNNNNEEMINMKDFENLGNDEKKMIITMNDMFMNIEKYLTKMIKENNLNEEKIFEKSIVTNPDYKKKKGIFIFGNKMIYSQTIKFYKGIVGNNPPRYSILFCNEETTLEELLAFLYLSLMCKYHSLFIILKPDQLQISLKIFLQEKIEKMYDDNIEIESLIIILFNDIGKSDIGKELINMRNIKKIEEPNILLDTINEIEVVSSSLAGYGKSTYIKKEFEKKYEKELKNGSFKYIQFPLGGEVKRSIILRRLKDLNINHDFSYGLHLDLSETNQIELFEDFLFSFLILKEYTQNEDIFCYQKNVEIKIEIPKGFYDFSEKFNLLKLFKQKKITSLPEFKILNDLDKNFDDENDIKKDKKLYENYKKNISYFNYLQTTLDSKIIPKEIIDLRKNHRYLYQSDIQIVCNYLDLYDSNKELLRKKNIFFYSFAQIDYELDENDWYYYSKFIDEKKCGELIQKYLKIPNCSYHQINIFIKVLCHQLKLFSNNYNLMAETLYAGEIDGIIRENLIKAFLNLTQFFTIGAFNELVTEQKDSISNYNEDIIKKSIEALEAKEKTINFEILNENSLVCIDEDGQSITILTNCAHDSKEYKDLENLLNMGRNFKENEKRLRLIDFTSNENDNNNFDEKISEDEKAIPNFKFLKIIKKYLCLKDDEKKMREKIGSYTFTADNFFKMILILLRIKSKISVILMGETGCGKTSLINTICDLCGYNLLKITINASFNDNDIVSFIVKNKLNEDNIEYEENEDDRFEEESRSFSEISKIQDQSFTNKESNLEENENKLNDDKNGLNVVFFDEFNTCNSQGLFTEIMCKHTVQGKKIKDNVVFIAACNPYRKKINQIESTALIKKQFLYSDLVYTVNPLTYSQLYYVLNFGSLDSDNERKYVENIFEYELSKIIENREELKKIHSLTVEAFVSSQQYIREKNGKESVSLREIRKFLIIYNFIYKDFKRKQKLAKKKENDENESNINNIYITSDDEMTHKYAISIGIFICFYIRLNIKERNDFITKIQKILKIPFFSYSDILQEEIIKNIEFEKGIAANNTLKLNLFITFIGILTRIAVFLVGPPGCSKTLSLNLLKKEMKGINSKSKFWKQYPQLFVTSFQGSLTSTSHAIKQAFKRAQINLNVWLKKKKNLEKNENEEMNGNDIISLVFIDEIGLCEISPLNPLKVLHSYLELDYKNKRNEEKIAFVGISNWKLDASKMNRGIYLNVFSPESKKEDMYNTAVEISKIYSKSFIADESNENLLKNLSEVVFNYKLKLNNEKDENKNFHGTRDYYNLIKSVVRNILNKKDCNPIEEVFFSIESNYNGLLKQNECYSAKALEKEFIKKYPIENQNKFNIFNIRELIANNINDNESRFLLLITQSTLSQYLIMQLLKEENNDKEYIYLLGSLFEEDKFNEIYSTKQITKIKYYLEQPIILILKNLSTTYASLYDLFNQRFTYSLGKKYTEISIRDVTTSALIDDNLRIIVLIPKEVLSLQDPPFLNRFEKYVISYDSLLNQKQKDEAKKFLENKNIFEVDEKLKIIPKYELINFSEEEIKGIIFNSKLEENNNFDLSYEDKILSKLSKTFPQDLIVFLNTYKKKKKNYIDLIEKINNYYKKSIHSNLKNYLMSIESSKIIIYTFSSIIKIKFNFEIKNEKYQILEGEKIKHVLVNNIKSEKQLETIVEDFYSNNQNILMVHFENDKLENLEFISSFLERIEKEKKESKKLFILIIHLKRSLTTPFKDIYLTNLSSYEQSFIDNLHGRDEEICDLIEKSHKELYFSSLLNIEEEFLKNLYPAFITIEYLTNDKDFISNQYIQELINFILDDKELMNSIINIVVNKIEEKENIFDIIFKNYNFEDKEFTYLLVKGLKDKFKQYLIKFIVNSEKYGFLSFHYKKYSGLSEEIWKKYLSNLDFFENEINLNPEGNKINLESDNLPSNDLIKNIRKVIDIRKNEYQEEESKIRSFSQPSDLLFEIYEEEEENSPEYIEKEKLINEYFEDNEENRLSIKYESVKNLIESYFIFPKKDLIDYILKILHQDEIYSLIPNNQLKEGLDLLFEDYYKHYYIDIIGEEKKEYLKLLKLLTHLRFSFNDTDIEILYIKNILWLEIYKDEMTYIFNILKDTLIIEPDIIDLIEKKIKNNDVEYIVSQHHPSFKKEVNYPFLIFLDSVSYIMMEIILKKDFQSLKNNQNFFSNINKNSEILNSNLRLLSKDFYRFKFTYLVLELLIKKDLKNKELEKYVLSVFSERKYIKEDKISEAFNEFNEQYVILTQNFSGNEGFEKLIISLIVSKYKEVNNDDFRSQLCNLIKNNKNLLKSSTEFFVLIFKKYNIRPYFLDENNDDDLNPFTFKQKDNIILKTIDGGEKGMSNELKEILKIIFKFIINKYFEEELEINNINPKENDKRGEISVLIEGNAFIDFKNAYENLKSIMFNPKNEMYNKNIKEQYCIVYCNIYLENFVKFCFTEKEYSAGIRNDFFNFLNNPQTQTDLKKTMKIVILKLIKTNYIKDQIEFVNNKDKWSSDYHFEEIIKDYEFISSKNLFNIFYNGNDEEEFNQLLAQKTDIDENGGRFENLNDNTFFSILDCFINQEIGNLKSNKEMKFVSKNSQVSFKDYIDHKKNPVTTELFKLFFDENTFNTRTKKIIKELNTEEYELILYSYKLAFSCSLSNENSIYSKMMGECCMTEIFDSYIPGAELFSDLFVESYFTINKLIELSNKDAYGEGFYVCNCGEWYYNPPCGVPVNITYCLNCKKEIGGNDEILTKRGKEKYEKEIRRVYYNEGNKRKVESREDLIERYEYRLKEWYDSILLKDYKIEIENKMNQDYKGILCNNYLLFLKENKKIRKMSQISYRILSFVLYSNIFFNYILEYIKDKDILEKELIPFKEEEFKGELVGKEDDEEDSFSKWVDFRIKILQKRKEQRKISDIMNILKKNWELLNKALIKEDITSIHCFMNIIFTPLNELIKNSKEMKTPEERNEFEEKFEEIVKDLIIKKDSSKYKNYIKINNSYQNINNDLVLGSPLNIDEKYRYLYELYSVKTVSIEGLKNILNSIENSYDSYPVLNNYLETNKESIEYLQNINLMNDFVLFTIENYSYQIDRDTAKNLKMTSEIKNKKIPEKSFQNFKIAYNDHKIYLKELQYNCHVLKNDIIPIKELDEKKDPSLPLFAFLIDNGEYGHGMKIAAVYSDFIKIQNKFLNNVKSKIEKNDKLKNLVKKISQKIPPQKAKKFNIISFKINSENYSSFNQMLLLYSYKDKYGNIKYDLNAIEEELEILLLREKKILDENQLYVIYQYESFRNNNSTIIPDFCLNFPQKELTNSEKEQLYYFRNEQESNDSNNKILFSIQLLIFFLRDKNKKEFGENKTMKSIISDNILPNYIHLSKETIDLFNKTEFTLHKLFSVYEYFELLCYDDFKKNTNIEYSVKLPEEKIIRINNYFNEKDKGNGYLITKIVLSGAVRKLISRFLSGKREEQDISPQNELFLYLQYREDIWKKEIKDNANFDKEISELSEFKILVQHSIDLYDVLGGDKNLLGDEVIKEMEIQEEKRIEEENKQKIEERNNNRNRSRRNRMQEVIF